MCNFLALLNLGVKPFYLYISLYLIYQCEVILPILRVKSESIAFVFVVKL